MSKVVHVLQVVLREESVARVEREPRLIHILDLVIVVLTVATPKDTISGTFSEVLPSTI